MIPQFSHSHTVERYLINKAVLSSPVLLPAVKTKNDTDVSIKVRKETSWPTSRQLVQNWWVTVKTAPGFRFQITRPPSHWGTEGHHNYCSLSPGSSLTVRGWKKYLINITTIKTLLASLEILSFFLPLKEQIIRLDVTWWTPVPTPVPARKYTGAEWIILCCCTAPSIFPTIRPVVSVTISGGHSALFPQNRFPRHLMCNQGVY